VKVTWLPDAEPRTRRVAIGTFDGVHLGHREVIRGCDTVLTFHPHPQSVVRPGEGPRLLTGLARKTELVSSLDVEELVVIPFDTEFSSKTAEEFVDEVLAGKLQAEHVSIGENFRFGNRAKGDAALLQADDRFETRVVELVEVDGEIVSSSHIRGLLQAGDVETAARLLGAAFQVCGEVVPGDKRGRTLGFPTANLLPDPEFVWPGHGVYACIVEGHAAAVNVGVRPMFDETRKELLEAYLIDFEGDLYGREIHVDFHKRLRGEKRFDTVDALIQQMARDVDETRAVVAGRPS
jgi:riboflavin kinase / FMN adenylyltransferase